MNRSRISNKSYKKKKISGFRRLSSHHTGRKTLKRKRKKGRKIL